MSSYFSKPFLILFLISLIMVFAFSMMINLALTKEKPPLPTAIIPKRQWKMPKCSFPLPFTKAPFQ